MLHVPPGEVPTAKEGKAGFSVCGEKLGTKGCPAESTDEDRVAPQPPPTPGAYLASKVRAMMPAARGAEAEVPVCDSVHFCRKSVVTCPENSGGWRGPGR